MKHFILFFLIYVVFTSGSLAQNFFLYFDKFERKVDKEDGYSCLAFTLKADNTYDFNWYYLSNSGPYFSGQLLSIDSVNGILVYKDSCTWYYKDGTKKAQLEYNGSGQLNGMATRFYENGNKQSEYIYSNGIRSADTGKEFDEAGNQFLVFKDDFSNKSGDWDLYDSDKSFSDIKDGKLVLQSKLIAGTARFISYPLKSEDWSYEAEFTYDKKKSPVVHGFVFNFKDWNNHGFFIVFGDNFSVGFISEGVRTVLGDKISYGNFDSKKNTLRILSKDGQLNFLVNGEVHYTFNKPQSLSSKFGPMVIGKAKVYCDNIVFKTASK
jgi:antitoxin component YwqK of YwqJK toxin-antitoxin module